MEDLQCNAKGLVLKILLFAAKTLIQLEPILKQDEVQFLDEKY